MAPTEIPAVDEAIKPEAPDGHLFPSNGYPPCNPLPPISQTQWHILLRAQRLDVSRVDGAKENHSVMITGDDPCTFIPWLTQASVDSPEQSDAQHPLASRRTDYSSST